jgi:hypothetical protein
MNKKVFAFTSLLLSAVVLNTNPCFSLDSSIEEEKGKNFVVAKRQPVRYASTRGEFINILINQGNIRDIQQKILGTLVGDPLLYERRKAAAAFPLVMLTDGPFMYREDLRNPVPVFLTFPDIEALANEGDIKGILLKFKGLYEGSYGYNTINLAAVRTFIDTLVSQGQAGVIYLKFVGLFEG